MNKQDFSRIAADRSQLEKFKNEAIDAINGSSSGTKLYKHTIAGLTFGNTFHKLDLITLSPTPLTSVQEISGSGYLAVFYATDATDKDLQAFAVALKYNGSAWSLLLLRQSSSSPYIDSVETTEIDTITDTVTEL